MQRGHRGSDSAKKASKLLLSTLLLLGLLTAPAYAQTLSFERTWGGSNYDYGYGVAVDPSGNIYVTGYTSSFGAGGADVVLLKYDPSGSLLWQKTWGGTSDDYGRSVAVDTSGNIYVTGYTYSFSVGGYDVFLLKYNPSGSLSWRRTWGGSDYDYGYGVAVDPSGNIYVTGYTYSFSVGGYDVFLLKYDPSGSLLWQKTWGGSNYDYGYGVAVDPSGNIYVTGATYSFSVGSYDVFLLKYDPSGSLSWQKTWGGSSSEYGYGVAVDPSGNIYVTGYTYSFGAGGADAFLLKYNPSGSLSWQKTWGGSSNDYGYGVAVDPSGNIYVTGYTYSFDVGGYGVVLLKYGSSGNLLWRSTWGGLNYDYGYGVAVDSSSNIYLTGYTTNPSRTLNSATGVDGTPIGSQTTPSGTEGAPSGSETTTGGTQTTPSGSTTYAGNGDIFLLKFTSGGYGAFTVTICVKDAASGRPIGNAQIFLDGISKGFSNAMGLLTVPNIASGTHTATASMAGYSAPVVTFPVTRSTSVTVPLTSTVATNTVTVRVWIVSTSTGIANAMVYVDGAYAGTTNAAGQLSLTLRTGTHTFTVARSGYITNTQLSSSTTVTIYLTPR
jgi:uncharacterized delta-60 repeat protein